MIEVFTIELKGRKVSQKVILVVHASVNVHGVVDNTSSMTLTTRGQDSKCRHGLPFVGLRVVAPNVVVEELFICTSETNEHKKCKTQKNEELILCRVPPPWVGRVQRV